MTTPDKEARQREAFERWAQTISLRILKCRVQGHQFPDWDHKSSRVARQRQAHTADRDPNKAYMMPATARTGHGYTRGQRAYLRREYLARLSEWITEE